MKESDSSL
jgi:hypothetical protein